MALLAGCGGGGSTDAARPTPAASATVEPPAASSPGIGPDGTAPTDPPKPGTPATTQATVPRARLTPATGTFTEAQQEYLVGKVPTGMDPSAILQVGLESCDRIANTADASPRLARQAIEDGEIADARDAITYLCPKFKTLLG
ncbi:hypothetical protein [Streptomyces sp.]|uniref:hypothetical protein n=1 Tax=Streptomyces sp. TaxID=1931 RepID=UPI0039C9540A